MSENHSTMANVGKQIKEGRHVGLDFYDLLIEALIDPGHGRSASLDECNRDLSLTEDLLCTKPGVLSANACYQ